MGIKPWLLERCPQSFVGNRAWEVRAAVQHATNTLGYNNAETTKVAPNEYALGGFGGTEAQRTLSRMVTQHISGTIRTGLSEDWKRGSTARVETITQEPLTGSR